jgi:amino acid adenylation domain-containing protein
MAKNDIETILPLSPLQQGLLFHALADRGEDPYFIQAGFALTGELDVAAFSSAWQTSAVRHAVLRTAFVWEKVEQPLQVVRTEAVVPLAEHDLRALDGSAQSAAIEAILQADRAQGFSLLKAPLMRLTLIRMSDRTTYFYNSHHHLLLDGWSFALLLREVFLSYRARLQNRAPALPPVTAYREYLSWVGRRDRAQAERYFRSALLGFVEPTPLPMAALADRKHTRAELAHPELGFAEQELSLSRAETEAVQALARQQRVTLNTLVQGAFALLLARHAGQREVVFGSTVSGRPPALPSSDAIVGVLINTLPVRVAIDHAQPLGSFLRQLQAHNGELREYEWMPLTDVQRNSQVPSGTPLFESIVVFDSYPEEDVERAKDDLEVRSLPRSARTEGAALLTAGRNNYPLSLMVEPNASLKLIAAYARDRLTHRSATSLLAQLKTLLKAMVERPDARLGELSLVSREERARQLQTVDESIARASADRTVHARIEAHAARTPDAIAVRCEGATLSYRELDELANAVALRLRALGSAAEARVGLCTERSLAMVVGLLAALKAGAAYVPIDPKFPPERIDEILRDSGASVLLTTGELAASLERPGRSLLVLDCVERAVSPPSLRASERSLAYLIYTSGSTGRPKGVAVEHGQLLAYLDGVFARLPLAEVASFALVSTVAADLGHTSLFGALCSGRTLHVVSTERTFDPDAFAELMHREQVDALKIVPTHLTALLEAAEPARVLPRRCLIVGGEAANPSLIARIRQLAPGCAIVNHYGPTETTVGALTYRVEAATSDPLPIGRPLASARAYVLGDDRDLLPIGGAGELYIGGASVARGYHDRPGLTAERFVPDPFASSPGARLYRTGDRARVRDDGEIEFLGRVDHQLKVRGNRVELGEIEARLRSLPDVRDAVVVARVDGGATRLVGYVVADAALDLEPLRQTLARSLPDYMVPSALVRLAALPLSVNGKVDRAALPSEERSSEPAAQRVAPSGPIELALAEIWRGVLGIEELSVHDNFFARGGDSIRTLQVIARANQRGIKLSPKHLFEHPTIAQVARVAVLKDAAAQPAASAPAPFALTGLDAQALARALPARERLEDAYPLSPMQEGMLFHTRLRPGTGIYLMQQHYSWSGPLDVARVTEAWRLVAERHPILRTSFVWEELERPLQCVHRSVDFRDVVQLLDLRGLDQTTQEARVRETLEAELVTGLDLAVAPLMRVRLFQLSDDGYRIVRSFHHILTDDWCFSVLMMECLQFYAALGEGRTLSLPAPRPYRDYIAWLANSDQKAAEAFYRRELSGFAAATPLGIERAVPDERSPGVGDAFFELTPEVSDALMALANEHALTPNTFVQGAWAVLLSRYAQTNDVLFGVTVAGRPTDLPGVESIVGLFINSLPLRVDVAPAQPLLPWLKELLAHNYRLREYEHPALVHIQQWSDLPQGEALFKSLIVFENAPQDERLGEQVREVEVAFDHDRVHTNYPLTVVAYPGPRLGVRISFDRTRFELADVQRMLTHLRVLLEAMVARPTARLGQLAMLLPEESARELAAVDAPASAQRQPGEDYARLFEAQVARTPDAVAVAAGGRELSYDALNRAANRVAHALRAEGVRADRVVAVLEARELELVISLLGVLKAGAAYLPLEPGQPPARLAEIVRQSAAQVVLCSEALAPLARQAAPGGRVIVRDQIAARAGQAQNLGLSVHPRQLAYVIFTSGSTGVPKGAMVDHAGMLNNVWGKLPTLELGAADVVAQTASQCFDISVWQLLSPMLAGARVQIVPDEVVRDPRALLDEVDRRGVTVLELVPSLLRELIVEAEGRARALSSVRWVLPTGEALTPELCRRWFARFPALPLLNAYGPAECADDVALHRITEAPSAATLYMPIGKPVPNLRLYVTSGEQLAPPGVAGELCVAGVGVGRGYVGDAARTASAFVPDPFSRVPGERMYRTGDLARRNVDGTLVFVGRRDHQVKVRGYRIELGEIESRLAHVAGVEQAVVLARDDHGRGAQLIAYVVGRDLPVDRLRAALARELPAYMVPSAFVWLEALPLNSNGKVDRARLPAPELADLQEEAPVTGTERKLAAIWAEVLALPSVGRSSSFFALGGHSLLATQVISRVRKVFHVDLPLRSLFDLPTVAGLASEIDRTVALGPDAHPLVSVPRDAPLPLSFAQQRLWFLSQLESDRAAYNMSAAVQVDGALDRRALERAFAALIARHEALRTVFVTIAGEPMQKVAEPGELPFTFVDLRARAELERRSTLEQIAQQHVARPFELEQGPLVRLLSVQLAEREHALVLALHHIVADGWSLNVLVSELAELYAAELAGRVPSLSPLAIQYADFAFWQRRWMEATRTPQLAYWRARLHDAPTLDLRPDRARAPGLSVSELSARYEQTIERELATALCNQRDGTTLFMRLLAVYKLALARRSGQTDLLVGTDVANRNRPETESVVGFFVNLLALRTDLRGDPSLRELVERVRETTLQAYEHQDLPFEQVVDAVRPVRERDQHPLVQSLFVLQNTPTTELELADVRFRPLELERETSRFDLGVFAEELDEGISLTWKYRSDLFDAATITALANDFAGLLRALVSDPEQRISTLAASQKRERRSEQRGKLRSVRKGATAERPATVGDGASSQRFVSTRTLDANGLPLLIEPAVAEVDLAAWARSERADIEAQLRHHGALLFRGFGLRSVADFERVAEAVCPELYGEYGDLPREKTGRHVYGSTPYPEDETILFHNESSHLPRWPRMQWFFCVQPSLEGGATPIVDCRRMLRELDVAIVERFERLGLRYVRNFTPGFDVSWQDFFQTSDVGSVEARCAREGMGCVWLPGESLRISQLAPGVITHPLTGERAFFNQVQLHHPDYLAESVRRSLRALVGDAGLPRNVTYGDGAPIDAETTRAIGQAYERCAIRYAWQAGDLLLLDNMLVAHARDPFSGPRKIVVAMGEMQSRADLEVRT